jgi:hypothetical protein
MNERRDRLLLWSGILIGAACGLVVGVILFVTSMVAFMHHMFIFGIHWVTAWTLLIFPIALLILAASLLRRAKRLPA